MGASRISVSKNEVFRNNFVFGTALAHGALAIYALAYLTYQAATVARDSLCDFSSEICVMDHFVI
jgi:hypothetical protein